MARKKWEAHTEVTPTLLRTREKRKWQIALRRYVLEKNICLEYAPYFGLDIYQMRRWFECQFQAGADWHNFGEHWQFGHVLPVNYFDFSREDELRMCWNFINLKVEVTEPEHEKGGGREILTAKAYFTQLLSETDFPVCAQLLKKISLLENIDEVSPRAQAAFIQENAELFKTLSGFGTYEFEMVNRGRPLQEVLEESALLRKFQ